MRPEHWSRLSTNRRQRLRRGAITATLLFATLQIANIAHLASAHHAVCAEHGEEIETDDQAGDHDPPAQDLSAIAEAGHQHHHAHCAALSMHRRGASPLAKGIVLPAMAVVVAATGGVVSVAIDRSQTFRFAPKGSPPGN
jgi:hypothetical protein